MRGIRIKIIYPSMIVAVFIAGLIFLHLERPYKSFEIIKITENINYQNHTAFCNYFPKYLNLKTTEIKNNENETHININNANTKSLIKLYGIGEKMAKRIIDYRNKNGSFEVIEDIMRVDGISIKTFDKIKNRICVK